MNTCSILTLTFREVFRRAITVSDHMLSCAHGPDFYPILRGHLQRAQCCHPGISASADWARHWNGGRGCCGFSSSDPQEYDDVDLQNRRVLSAAFQTCLGLTHRAVEMKPGARLCLFNFGIDGGGQYLGNTGGVNMFDTFNALWAGMRGDGVITPDEYLSTNFPQCYRTEEEFVAPIGELDGPVHQAGLRLEHVEARTVRCPF